MRYNNSWPLFLSKINEPAAQATAEGKDSEMKKILASLSLCLLLSCTAFAASKEDLQDRIDAAKAVLDQVMSAQDHTIFMNIMQQATCVGVVPGLIKGRLKLGAQYGQGVVTCRTGHGWSAPVFIRMAGGSWDSRLKCQSTDLVLVAVNDHGFQDLLKNEFQDRRRCGSHSRSGGTQWPGRYRLEDERAELLTYSRSKGLFAGVDLDGTVVSQNKEDTEVYFGHLHSFEAILKKEP